MATGSEVQFASDPLRGQMSQKALYSCYPSAKKWTLAKHGLSLRAHTRSKIVKTRRRQLCLPLRPLLMPILPAIPWLQYSQQKSDLLANLSGSIGQDAVWHKTIHIRVNTEHMRFKPRCTFLSCQFKPMLLSIFLKVTCSSASAHKRYVRCRL